jgi:predicted nucleic acid-binding protein
MDTGPLVAYRRRRDSHHIWAVSAFETIEPPLISCEPVLSETCFLLVRAGLPTGWLFEQIERGIIRIGLRIDEELTAIHALMQRYESVPMSLADACLVRLAELTGLPICTLDGDFAIYRANRRRPLTLITPPGPRSLHEP